MNYAKQDKLTLFAENTQAMKKGFIWHDSIVKRLAALLYALKDKPINYEDIRECHNLVKRKAGAFSTLRGNMSVCIAAMLSLHGDCEAQLNNTISVYDMMKKAKFRASDYLAIAAYQIAANAPKEQYQQTVENARAFYEGMKSYRWFLTGQDDYIYAAMLALSGVGVKDGVDRIEQLYQSLKPEFRSGNSVQALSQILVLGGKTDEAIDHLLSLRNALRNRKLKFDKTYTLPALGVLALLPVETETIADDIYEAQLFLKSQKGFGAFSVSSQELLLYASAIISNGYADSMDGSISTATISTTLASILIAQQTAIIAAMVASSVAASTYS